MGRHIYINNKQAALVLDKNGWHSLYIPKQPEDDEVVPDHIVFLTTIAVLLKTEDKRFRGYMKRRIQELFINDKQ